MTTPRTFVTALALASLGLAACRSGGSSAKPSPSASSRSAHAPPSSSAPRVESPAPVPPPVLALADAPGPAPSGAPVDRAVRETAVLALLADATFVRRLPVVELEPGREFDTTLRDRVAPRIVVPEPKVSFVETKVEGGLSKELVQRVMRQSFGRYRACVADVAPEAPNLSGRVTLELAIARSGQVENVRGDSATLKHGAALRCIVDVTRALEFPPAREPTRGVQTLAFEAVSAEKRP